MPKLVQCDAWLRLHGTCLRVAPAQTGALTTAGGDAVLAAAGASRSQRGDPQPEPLRLDEPDTHAGEHGARGPWAGPMHCLRTTSLLRMSTNAADPSQMGREHRWLSIPGRPCQMTAKFPSPKKMVGGGGGLGGGMRVSARRGKNPNAGPHHDQQVSPKRSTLKQI